MEAGEEDIPLHGFTIHMPQVGIQGGETGCSTGGFPCTDRNIRLREE